jgi:hypothetical protein
MFVQGRAECGKKTTAKLSDSRAPFESSENVFYLCKDEQERHEGFHNKKLTSLFSFWQISFANQ